MSDAVDDTTDRSRVTSPEASPWQQSLSYLRAPFDAMERWAAQGDVVHVDVFTDTGAYLVTDPAMVTAILTTHSDSFRKGEVRRKKFERVLGQGVHDAPRDLWDRTQPIIAPHFGYQRVQAACDDLYAGVEAAADDLAADVRDAAGQVPLDAASFSEALTLELLARYVFGEPLPADLREMVLEGGELVMCEVRPTYGSLLPTWVPTPRRVRLKRQLQAIDEYVYDRIDAVLDGDATNEYLEQLHEANPELFERDQLRDEYITIIAAGHRTTSTALTAGLGVLARNTDVAERLRDDVAALLDTHDSLPDAVRSSDVENRYLGAFIREVLRLYPPSPHILRDARTDVEIEGVRIPEGATVWLPQWVLHRDDRFWTDPRTFRPQRWLTGDATPNDDCYLPFGAGPRRCLGQYLADAEMQLVFAELIDRFRFEPAGDEPLSLAPSLTTMVTSGADLLVSRR